MLAGDEAAAEGRRALIREIWRERLHGVQRNHEVWQVGMLVEGFPTASPSHSLGALTTLAVLPQSLLSVRSLVLPMHEDTHTWLKFASLCRKSGRPK